MRRGTLAVMDAADPREQIERAKADGIRFIQLQFTDVIGHVKAVTIPIHQLEGSVQHGTWQKRKPGGRSYRIAKIYRRLYC